MITLRGMVFLFIFLFILSCLIGCETDDNDRGGAGPVLPTVTQTISPNDGSLNVPVTPELIWSFTDTLAAAPVFDLYLGTTNPPSLYRSGLIDTIITVGPLFMNTLYYWKVCGHDGLDSSVSKISTFTTDASFTFPVTIGNRWNYNRTVMIISDYDSLIGQTYDTIRSTALVEISEENTLGDSLPVLVFYTQTSESSPSTDWRFETDDGLYLLAYSGSGWVGPPKQVVNSDIFYECKGLRFTSLTTLVSIIRTGIIPSRKRMTPDSTVEDPPIRELAYPMAAGLRWTYQDTDLGDPWNMEKEILALDTIVVPAGTFECYKVRWFWDINDDGQWDTDVDGYDFISAGGTVKRIFDYPDIYVTNNEGDTIGVSNWYEEYDLIYYNLE